MSMKCLQIILLTWLASLVASVATPAQAETIFLEYNAKIKAWEKQLALATSMEEMRKTVMLKPNGVAYRDRMIKVVGTELKNPWTLKYAGWLISNTPVGKKDTAFIMQYAEKFHMNSPNLGEFCFNVAASSQPVNVKRTFIEKAMKSIKDKRQKGIASISLAAVLSEIGDSARNNERRLTLVRQAIIDSADVKVGNSTVGDTAMEMVYRMRNLSKGRLAPAVVGADSSGKQVSLSSYRGRVVMLVFWSSFDLETEQTVKLLELIRRTEKDYLGKDFALVGVNKDQLKHLRELEKEDLTSSVNIADPQRRIFGDYRVNTAPHCYVIDKQGIIGYSGAVGSFATLTVDALLSAKPTGITPRPALKPAIR